MKDREKVFLNSVFFVLGFMLVFSALGLAFQTVLAHTSHALMNELRVAGGIVIVLFGSLMLISMKYIVPFFSTEHRLHAKRFGNSYLSSLVFGIAFALGWTPCVGAILGSIYTLAATEPGLGLLLLLAYSLGLGIPFLIAGAFISKVSDLLKKMRGALRYFNLVSGLLLIGIGIMVITGYIGVLSVFLVGQGSSMSLANQLNFIFAIFAGILTFFSPCILPIVPAYFSYIGGTATQEMKK